jgi:hypothetical protein
MCNFQMRRAEIHLTHTLSCTLPSGPTTEGPPQRAHLGKIHLSAGCCLTKQTQFSYYEILWCADGRAFRGRTKELIHINLVYKKQLHIYYYCNAFIYNTLELMLHTCGGASLLVQPQSRHSWQCNLPFLSNG